MHLRLTTGLVMTTLLSVMPPLLVISQTARLALAQATQGNTINSSVQAQTTPKSELPESWQEFSSTEGGFSVQMPGKPVQKALPSESGEKTVIFSVVSDKTSYQVAYVEAPVIAQWNSDQIKQALNVIRNDLINALKGKLLRERTIQQNKYSGREIIISMDNGVISKVRVYVVGSRYYTIVIGGSEAALKLKSGRFLDSFRLLKRVATASPSANSKLPTTTSAEAIHLLNLGMQQLEINNLEAAMQSTQQALKSFQQLKERRGIAQALGNIGIIYLYIGNGSQAFDYLQQALSLAREMPDQQIEGNALGSLGQLYLSRGEFAKAASHLQQALEIAKTINNQPAIAALQRLLREVQKQQESSANTEALAQAMRDDPIGTMQAFLRAGTPDPENKLLTEGVSLLMQKQYAKAIEVLKRYEVLVKQSTNPIEQLGLLNLAMAYWETRDFKQAEIVLRNYIQVLESWSGWSKSGLQSDKNNIASLTIARQTMVYEMLQQILAMQNQPEAALEISERGRGRALTNLLTQKLSPKSTVFAAPPPTVAELRNIAKTQKATLVEYSIIEYSTNPGQGILFIWVIQPSGKIAFRKVDLTTLKTPLNQLVISSRIAIGVPNVPQRATVVATHAPGVLLDSAKQTQQLQQLHKLLIEPIADLLPKDVNDRVIFVPQGALFLVPFPALQDAKGKYLIEQHTILTAPAIQALALTRQKAIVQRSNKTAKGTALVVGNPTMPKVTFKLGDLPVQLSNLPGARDEAVAIAQLLNTQPILGQQATKAEVVKQMANARIIHLATHGLLDTFKGDTPGAIALGASGNGEINDGLLTSGEIFDMKLNADLVVLSACDTGRGDLTGDGVIGLSRTLFIAGVPSVIVSLWSVPDAPTAQLMSQFYRNLQQPNINKAQALRQAMISTMKTHPNPIDWAAFTLIGEAE